MQWIYVINNLQRIECPKVRAMIGILLVCMGNTYAESTPIEPQAVATVEIKLVRPGEESCQEPNEIPASQDHPPVKIHGEIVVMGKPIPGVMIEVDKGDTSVTTDKKGQYVVEVPYRWSGKITPIKEGWIFDPPYRAYEYVREDIDGRNLPDNPFLAPEVKVCEDTPPTTTDPAPVALGRLGISPMVLSLEAKPGEVQSKIVTLQNMGAWTPEVKLAVAKLEQERCGQWIPVEPNLADPESLRHTCGSWLSFPAYDDTPIRLPSMGTMTCPVTVKVPAQARGFYSAAIVIQPQGMPNANTSIGYNLVVPVLVSVNEEKAASHIRLKDIELVIPFNNRATDCPRVRLHATNQGDTFSRVGASVQFTTSPTSTGIGDSNEIHFEETWIMPGATVILEADYQGPHPDQALSVFGSLKRIKAQPFTRNLMGAKDRTFTLEPTQTLAMLDYDDEHVFKLEQDRTSSNPYFTYVGHCSIGMVTNFPAFVRTLVQPCSPAQGRWTVSTCPTEIDRPTNVQLTVNAKKLNIDTLPGGARNLAVAEVVVQLIPQTTRWRP